MELWKDIWRYAFASYDTPHTADQLKYHGQPINEVIDWYSAESKRDYGFICEEKDRIIIALRGTCNIEGWEDNFNAFPYDHEFYGKVLNGFHDAFVDCGYYSLIRNYKNKLDAEGVSKPLIVTGHSRGAGLALMCSWHLAKELKWIGTNINFAAPAIGDKAFADEYNELIPDTTNVYIQYDPLYNSKIMRAAGLVHCGKSVVCLRSPWWHCIVPFNAMLDHKSEQFDKRVCSEK